MAYKFLETFYKPPPELTAQLVEASEEGPLWLPHARVDPSGRLVVSEEDPSTYIVGAEQAATLLAAYESDLPEPLMEIAAEDIALRLWRYWANLARLLTTVPDQTGVPSQGERLYLDQSTWGKLVQDLRRSLAIGLGHSELVSTLLSGFFTWLQGDQKGRFVAPWGEMKLEGYYLWFENVSVRKFLTGDYEKATSRRNPKAAKEASAQFDNKGIRELFEQPKPLSQPILEIDSQ